MATLTDKLVTDKRLRNRLVTLLNNIDYKQSANVPHNDCTRSLARLLNEKDSK